MCFDSDWLEGSPEEKTILLPLSVSVIQVDRFWSENTWLSSFSMQ